MSSRLVVCSRALGLALFAACGPPAFTPAFPESQEPEITRSLRALAEPQEIEARPVVAGIGPSGLFAFDLATGQVLWQREVTAQSAPVVAGDFVVTHEAGGITGRRLADGEVRFRLDEEWRLVGAHGVGERVVVSAAVGSVETPRGVIALVKDDDVRWVHELDMPVGRAALVGQRVLVPWATLRMSILDLGTGRELARTRMLDSVVGHAFVQDGVAYVGQHGLFRVQPGLEAGRRDAVPYYEPAGRPLPGQPPLLPDGYQTVAPPDSATHKVRLGWRAISEGDRVSLLSDTLYYVFYKLVFALDANADEIRWVHVHPTDVVGFEVTRQGPVLVDSSGAVVGLDPATGAARFTKSIGTEVQVASVRAGTAELAGEAPADAEPQPLAAQLLAAASLDDARLGGGRALAARHLGRHEGADVTGQLVSLCSDRGAPESARIAACEQVATRTEGVEHVRAAIAKHGSFLDDVQAPPVGALARAAGSMRARGLVSSLVAHIEDPATPNAELPGLFEGLAALGDASVVRPIESFLQMYHAERDDQELTNAVIAAARALHTLQGERSRATLDAVVNDPLTSEPVRSGIRAARAEAEAAAQAAAQAEAAAEAERRATRQPEPEAEPDTRPARITAQITAQVMSPVERRLRECLGEAPQARIALVVAPGGAIETVVVSPSALQECIEPIVRERTFPATQMARREQVTHVVRAPSE